MHSTLQRQIKVNHGTLTPTTSGPLHMHIDRHYQGPINLFLVLQTHHNTCKYIVYNLSQLTFTTVAQCLQNNAITNHKSKQIPKVP